MGPHQEEQLQRSLQARSRDESQSQREYQPNGARVGINRKSLHVWIRQNGEPLDIDTASAKELPNRVKTKAHIADLDAALTIVAKVYWSTPSF
jgi:hypothetical protein